MAQIMQVEGAQAFIVSLPSPLDIFEVFIVANGKVSTSGWSSPRLVPRVEATSKIINDVWSFDFVADDPTGVVLQVELPISASYAGQVPAGIKTVRIYGESGHIEAQLIGGSNRIAPIPRKTSRINTVIFRRTLGGYSDSHQPTGTIIWVNDGPLGAPMPHAEMKRLDHSLTLEVEGPDNQKINDCVNTSLTDGILAGLIAGFASGGLAGIGAAGSAFLETLLTCLGTGFTAKLFDDSHWVYWTT